MRRYRETIRSRTAPEAAVAPPTVMPLAIMPAQSNVPQANAVSSVSSSASLGPLPGSLSRRAISMRELRSSRRVSAESQQAANDDISPPILRTLQSSLDNVAMV